MLIDFFDSFKWFLTVKSDLIIGISIVAESLAAIWNVLMLKMLKQINQVYEKDFSDFNSKIDVLKTFSTCGLCKILKN